MISEKFLDFTVIFQPAEEGGYHVIVPALPGCFTQGETLEEARAMAMDAIEAFVASLRKDGEDIPSETGEFIGRIRIKAIPA